MLEIQQVLSMNIKQKIIMFFATDFYSGEFQFWGAGITQIIKINTLQESFHG